MENLSVSVTPFQMIIAFLLQVWMFILFPIIIIRKLNYLTELLRSQFDPESEAPHGE
ncbi:MAG: hypothetical protein ABIJ41_05780 [Candidatus Omnitrophota bacterium]